MSEPSFPLTMPTNRNFTKSEWTLKRSVAVTRSPFTYASQAAKFTGSQWTASVSLPPMSRAEASEWQVFFAQLNGNFGTFLMGDPDAKTKQGSMNNTFLVKTAAAIGAFDIVIYQADTGESGALKKGDYVQFGSAATARLHMIVSDVNVDGNGDATMQIEPPLKTAVVQDNVVVYNNTVCVMRMQNPDLSWSANRISVYGISFACEEVT
jgi:hypothetical protein|tara:strand:+ start:208 stop:834 length:627 start_codon:yes stop_codon:yes gene_type:complete